METQEIFFSQVDNRIMDLKFTPYNFSVLTLVARSFIY